MKKVNRPLLVVAFLNIQVAAFADSGPAWGHTTIWFGMPLSSSGDGKAIIQVDQAPMSIVSPKPSAARDGGGAGVAPTAERAATLLAADKRGFAALDEILDSIEADKQYRRWLGIAGAHMKTAFEATEKTPVVVLGEFASTEAIFDDLARAGAPVVPGRVGYSDKTKTDLYRTYGKQEKKHFERLIAREREELLEATGRADGDQRENDRALQHVVEMRSEFVTSGGNDRDRQREVSASLRSIQNRFQYVDRTNPVARSFREIGIRSAAQAELAIRENRPDDIKFYEDLATMMADLALGLTPVVGEGQCIYEAFTGKSLLTGELLTPFERGLAVAGIATFGLTTDLNKAAQLLGRMGVNTTALEIFAKAGKTTQQALPKLIAQARNIADKWRNLLPSSRMEEAMREIERSLTKNVKNAEMIEILSSEEANLKYLSKKPNHEVAFTPTDHHFVITTKEKDSDFVRFSYNKDNAIAEVSGPNGPSIAHRSDIDDILNSKSTTAQKALAIQARMALPHTPRFVTDVEVPAGTKLLVGSIARQFGKFKQPGGGRQYYLLDQISEQSFSNTRFIENMTSTK